MIGGCLKGGGSRVHQQSRETIALPFHRCISGDTSGLTADPALGQSMLHVGCQNFPYLTLDRDLVGSLGWCSSSTSETGLPCRSRHRPLIGEPSAADWLHTAACSRDIPWDLRQTNAGLPPIVREPGSSVRF
jgi:hypothetical protein